MIRTVKETLPSCKLVVGGSGFSVFAEKIMGLNPEIDFGVFSEGEYTFSDLLNNLEHPERVKNLFVRHSNSIVFTGRGNYVDFARLPPPLREPFDISKYKDKYCSIGIQTKRGCKFGCIYCLYPLGCGSVWRGRSPEGVLTELKMLEEEYKIKSILFRDQVFNFNPKRTEKICDGIIKEGINIEWRCEARVDFFSKNLLVKMKKAGCAGVHMGIESGDLAILKSVAKGCISADHIDKVKKVFRDAREIGLEALAFFMIGFPGETKESISKTFELARELKAKRAWFSPIVPYPGTKLYEIAKMKGWLLTENLEDYTGRKVVMRTDQLTGEDIRKAVDAGNVMFSKDKTQLLKTVFSSQGISSALRDPKKALKFTLGRIFNKNW